MGFHPHSHRRSHLHLVWRVIDLTPELILALWGAGISAAAAAVIWWRVVGPGFVWLSVGVILVVGIPAAVSGEDPVAAFAGLAAAAAAVVARRPAWAAPLLALAAGGYLAFAAGDGGVVPSLTGAAALGGMTAEMLLGHWFLIDPRLPRWALRRLGLAALAGLVADAAVLAWWGAFSGVDGVLLAAYAVLWGTSVALGVGVVFSLRQPGYAGVMAATGLSYLAVLTVVGSVVVGRGLIDGAVL